MAFRMRAKRCLCASVTAARLYGRSSSVPKPGIHIFQFRSKYSWTSFTSTFDTFRCFANIQAAFTVFSTKSSAIWSNNSSTSSSSCSVGSISRTSSCNLGFVNNDGYNESKQLLNGWNIIDWVLILHTGASLLVLADCVCEVDAPDGVAFVDEAPALLWLFSVGDKIISGMKQTK